MEDKPRSTIICVDDEKMLLNILSEQLEEWIGAHYAIEKALSAEEALEILSDCKENNIDVSVMISDYIMPNMKGDELLEEVKKRDPRIRKIMLTGYSSLEGIVSAINRAGLYRYITKPWDNRDLMLTVVEAIKSFEQEKKASDLSKGFENLYKRYEKLYFDLQENYDNTIKAMATSIDARDPMTAGHSLRVAKYAVTVGRVRGMNESDLKFLEDAATLHDLGKIGMTDQQLKEMSGLQLYSRIAYVKQQNEIAGDILRSMHDSGRLVDGIKYHWEKYDGTGVYGLKGREIPIEAQIIGICNYYDLMVGNLARGQKVPPEAAAKIIQNTAGQVFSQELVTLFVGVLLKGALK